MSDCKSCNGFGYLRFPEAVRERDENGAMQMRWVYRKVKCAACFVQLELGL